MRTVFNFNPGEGRPLALLILHYYFLNIGLVLYYIASSALFLARFNADSLPYVYIGSGVAVPIVAGFIYSKFAARLSITRLWTLNLVFVLLSICAFRWVLQISESRWPVMLLLIWYEILENLIILESWDLAGRIFNLRQGKRLFGLIGSGAEIANMLGGLAVPLIVVVIGPANLLWLAASGVVCGIATMIYIIHAFPDKIQTAGEDKEEGERMPLSQLLKSRYLRLIFTIAALSAAVFYLVDFSFYDRAESRYPDAARLAGFFGVFEAVSGAVNLVAQSFVSGRLLNRYGIRVGLVCLPGLLLVGGVPALVAALGGWMALFFWLILLTRLFELVVRTAIHEPSILILYQPLAPDQRVGVQASVENYVKSIAGVVTGLALLLLSHFFGFNAMKAVYAIIALLAVWLGVAVLLRQEYIKTLTNALSKRILGGNRLSLADGSSIAVLKKGLRSPHPGEVIYCLKMLEEIQHESLETFLVDLLDHPAPEVRLDVLQRIERRGIASASARISGRLRDETVPSVKGALLRTLCALGESSVFAEVSAYLVDPDPHIRLGATVGLLRNGGIEGLRAGGERFLVHVHSANPEERQFAARVMGEAGLGGFYGPFLSLLADPDMDVRREAIKASGKLSDPRLWPALIDHLSVDSLRSVAMDALIACGEPVVPSLESAFDRPHQTNDIRMGLVRICGHLEGRRAVEMLLRKISFPDEKLRSQILRSLSLRGYHANPQEEPVIRQMIKNEVEDAAWTLAALVDVQPETGADILVRSLNHELYRNRERILLMLSFIYPPQPILRARAGMADDSAEQRSYAVEIVDSIISRDLKEMIIPLLDDITPVQRLSRLKALFPQHPMSPVERLKLLITRPLAMSSVWTRTCALYVSVEASSREFQDVIIEMTKNPHPLLRETAIWARERLNPGGEIK